MEEILINEFAFPCGGCICNHCANNVECLDRNAENECEEPCFTCDECRWFDGDIEKRYRERKQCEQYIVTESHARHLRRKIKTI